MKKTNRFLWLAGLSVTLMLLVLFFADAISWGILIRYISISLALTITGISVLLLHHVPRILKIAGLVSSWCGFLLLALGALSIVELSSMWNVAAALLLVGLLLGICIQAARSHAWTKWIALFSAVLFCAVIGGILLKLQNPILYQIGGFALILFSVAALLGSMVKSSAQQH